MIPFLFENQSLKTKLSMRSLLERFDGKVVAIEENKNLNTLKVDEFLATYTLLKQTLGLMRRHSQKVLL